jgi:uncharacterized protein (DUF58 family)
LLSGLFIIGFRLVAWWFYRRALDRIMYRRAFSQPRAFPGEELTLTVEAANYKWLPLSWLLAVDHWDEALPIYTADGGELPERPAGLLSLFFSLKGQERVKYTYYVRPQHRGIYLFGPTKLAGGDPFGVFQDELRDRRVERLIVYPNVVPIAELELPYQAPFGEVAAPRSLFRDPVRTVGVRDYHPEDSFRHVHWKASARRQDLQVRVFEPTTAYTLVVMLNVASFERHWEGVRSDILERLVCAAGSIANFAVEHRWSVGLTANGAMPNADQSIRIAPGRGPDQLSYLLEALAGVTHYVTDPFERFLLNESSQLAWGATLVVVSAIVNDEIMASLSRLRAAGRRVVLISLGKEPPEPPLGVLAYHVPNEGLAFEPGGGQVQFVPVKGQHGPASLPANPWRGRDRQRSAPAEVRA